MWYLICFLFSTVMAYITLYRSLLIVFFPTLQSLNLIIYLILLKYAGYNILAKILDEKPNPILDIFRYFIACLSIFLSLIIHETVYDSQRDLNRHEQCLVSRDTYQCTSIVYYTFISLRIITDVSYLLLKIYCLRLTLYSWSTTKSIYMICNMHSVTI